MSESVLWLLRDTHRARKHGPAAITRRQRARLAEMVAFARAHSPYYRELYRDLPERVEDVTLLPVTDKKKLMARFDEWTTDREVTLQKARAFVENPDRIGERFLGRHTVATTSGTTGTPGIFLIDDRSFAVTAALAVRMLRSWLGFGDLLRLIARGGRIAMVNATGGHFASTVAAARLHKRRGARVQMLSVHMRLSEMVARLNHFQPAVLASYASMGAMLASEQEAGRLCIRPALVVLSAEGLPEGEYGRIARAFQARVGHSYAATECPFLSYSCAHGWLHVNSDWVLLEPVDGEGRPVPPGQLSHTVLVSNLANRVQPILRYDLGDRVLLRPNPCPCGNPLPALRVQGRTADVLTFPTEKRKQVQIPPLAFEFDHILGVALLQVVQTTPTTLRLRLRVSPGTDAERVWEAVQNGIRRILAKYALDCVTIERAPEPPEQSPGGKVRTVIPLPREPGG